MFEHPLEKRCFEFAKRVRSFCRKLKRDSENIEDIKQVVRSSGSVGANYMPGGLSKEETQALIDEASQLRKIFSAMLKKLDQKDT